LVIVYGSVTNEENEPLSNVNATLLHIGNVTIPQSGGWMICMSGVVRVVCHQTG
jgi:hypothetical protein